MAQAPMTTPAVLPDVPDADDKLDFAPYANTLRSIILNLNTQAPLTIGIFGTWGSDKTSLMKMIERGLERAARDGASERQTYTVLNIELNFKLTAPLPLAAERILL
jgi:ABC-type polysaccharide/polyol phosphate transport system ATPase subunit